jgi:hypothetical protein
MHFAALGSPFRLRLEQFRALSPSSPVVKAADEYLALATPTPSASLSPAESLAMPVHDSAVAADAETKIDFHYQKRLQEVVQELKKVKENFLIHCTPLLDKATRSFTALVQVLIQEHEALEGAASPSLWCCFSGRGRHLQFESVQQLVADLQSVPEGERHEYEQEGYQHLERATKRWESQRAEAAAVEAARRQVGCSALTPSF